MTRVTTSQLAKMLGVDRRKASKLIRKYNVRTTEGPNHCNLISEKDALYLKARLAAEGKVATSEEVDEVRPEGYFTVPEARVATGLSVGTVAGRIHRGQTKVRRIRGHRFLSPTSVADLMKYAMS